ncbi:unnamed protein product [Caenorhabditis brenneri]
MNSINGSVDTSTVADIPMKDLILTYIIFLLGVLLILFFLFMFAYAAYIKSKSQREGPITLTPVIPFPQDNLQVFKGTYDFKNVVPDAKIQVCNGNYFDVDVQIRDQWAINEINEFMAWTFKLHCRLPHEYEEVRTETNERHYRIKPKISVPVNARTISIKMNGYEHGEKCHDFEPIGGAAPGSHFTYQMYGDNRIQVTRYVVDGESEIAGFCIYIEHPWISNLEYRWDLLNHMAQSAKTSTMPGIAGGRRNETNQRKIKLVPNETTNLMSQESDNREWTVKYCSKLRRKVMTSMDSDEVVVHQEWSDRNNQMKEVNCEECTKEGLGKEEQPPTYSSIFIV